MIKKLLKYSTRIIDYKYKLVTSLNKSFISRVVSSFSSELAMILSFFRVHSLGQKLLYKKGWEVGDFRFPVIAV